jgi:hypothetical protein
MTITGFVTALVIASRSSRVPTAAAVCAAEAVRSR